MNEELEILTDHDFEGNESDFFDLLSFIDVGYYNHKDRIQIIVDDININIRKDNIRFNYTIIDDEITLTVFDDNMNIDIIHDFDGHNVVVYE